MVNKVSGMKQEQKGYSCLFAILFLDALICALVVIEMRTVPVHLSI